MSENLSSLLALYTLFVLNLECVPLFILLEALTYRREFSVDSLHVVNPVVDLCLVYRLWNLLVFHYLVIFSACSTNQRLHLLLLIVDEMIVEALLHIALAL